MKLEQQVVSLELAKKLKELGVKQESYFHWRELEDATFLVSDCDCSSPDGDDIAAFTVAELGEMLPSIIIDFELKYRLKIEKTDIWEIIYEEVTNENEKGFLLVADDQTEADARAKMLIYLIENNLIKV